MAGMNVRDDVLNQIPKPKPSGRDLAYRAVAAVFGGPVDLTSMVMRPFGYGEEKPVLGSEWIGQQMQNVGLVSEARDPLQEFMASLLVPGGGIEAVPALAGKGMAMLPAAMGVVKAKGGNWLTGSVEDALRPLKKGRLAFHEPLPANAADDLEAYMRANPAAPGSELERIGNTELADTRRKVALNSWVEGPLTKYVKTRMASPDDEIRKLADQGVLHFTPDELGSFNRMLYGRRQELGQKPMGEATTDLGTNWEGLSDNALNVGIIGRDQFYVPKDVEWMGKLPSGTPIHEIPQGNGLATNLGLRHLTDELSNALNPESGLPRALQLSPDQMKNLSVEKAVRRVADINKWRANQMAEANKALAFDEKTAPIFKEYQTVPGHGNGQPNEKGLHWREIKAPEELPSTWSESNVPGVYKRSSDGTMLGRENAKKQVLQDQLAYEGDTMGHCVGGYCDAVLSGESQVYTLRDKAGKPHVTIEVQRKSLGEAEKLDGLSATVVDNLMSEVDDELYKVGREAFDDYGSPTPEASAMARQLAIDRGLLKNPEQVSIVQIKGAKNSAPKDEYVPFIQDFIRSGKFSDVGDLKNAQLVKASQTFNKTELQTLEKHGAKLTGEEYLTKAEVEALQSLFKSTNK